MWITTTDSFLIAMWSFLHTCSVCSRVTLFAAVFTCRCGVHSCHFLSFFLSLFFNTCHCCSSFSICGRRHDWKGELAPLTSNAIPFIIQLWLHIFRLSIVPVTNSSYSHVLLGLFHVPCSITIARSYSPTRCPFTM